MGRTGGIRIREIEYEPLPSQQRFHSSTARFKGFSGPIGSGKSQALCQEAIKLTYLNPGRMGLLGAPTFPMLRDATQATFFDLLERNAIPYEFNKAENLVLMKETRSKIVFRAVDDFERLRGTNLAWFGLDELTYTYEDAWLRLEGRLRDPKAKRLCGFAVWTPKGYDWVYRRFLSENKGQYETVIASAFENRFLLDKVPDFYDRLKTSYDATFYEQEVLGSYLNLTGGKVYSSFQRELHVRELEVDERLPLLWTLDFNFDPMSSVVAQLENGQLRVVDEIVLRKATTMDACAAFLNKYPRHLPGVRVYGDVSGYSAKTTGPSDYKTIKEYLTARSSMPVDYFVPTQNPAIRDRVNFINAKLRAANDEVNIFISPKCKELIKDLEQVAYKEGSTQIDKDRDRMRTHTSDALGYLVHREITRAGGEMGFRLTGF